jgi:hypothetical protein
MVNLKRIIDLTKKIQKNQKNENQVERNKTSQIELNYEIKNKLKIHKKTNNKLKIKRIRTQVKTLINQMITLKFCLSNVNFEGIIGKKRTESIANDKSHRQKKKDFVVLMTWWRRISTARRRFAYTNVCIANAKKFFLFK